MKPEDIFREIFISQCAACRITLGMNADEIAVVKMALSDSKLIMKTLMEVIE